MTERSARTTTKRRGAGTALIVLSILFALTAPLAALASGLRTHFVTTDGFVAALAPLASDPALQGDLAKQTVAVIESQVSLDDLARSGLGALLMGDRLNFSEDQVGLLADLLAGAARDALAGAVADALASRRFAAAWEQALRLSHTAVDALLMESGPGVIKLDGDGTVSIQLKPIIEFVAARLTERGYSWASRIRAVDREIVLVQTAHLTTARSVYQGIDRAGRFLPWLAVLLAAAGVSLAAGTARGRTRRRAKGETAASPVEQDSGTAISLVEQDSATATSPVEQDSATATSPVEKDSGTATSLVEQDSEPLRLSLQRATWRAGARWLAFAALWATLATGILEIVMHLARGAGAEALTGSAAISPQSADAVLRAVTGGLSYALLGAGSVLAGIAVAAFTVAFLAPRFRRGPRRTWDSHTADAAREAAD
ncbi:hypothetical protein GCM10010401_22500 [Rarobacter faecitabidus]|uniref:Uncharacterized protein n=1 Tax=Rarobacter faecitabidus TaxID=13243 RepID=A0A542ZVW8_RARFA|nr:hypothetical protein [Rarobacter faecitabidus]TQL64452.1 hypothetical protein FB461_0956 [Rarobacter faecitabidus]